jgi:hypothetical protein
MITIDSQFVGEMPKVGYILGHGSNPKTIKSDKGGVYSTAILNLRAGSAKICPWATKECIDACLDQGAGNPAYQAGKLKARTARTELFLYYRPEFIRRLVADCRQHVRRCERLGVKAAIRLNGTSDIVYETVLPEIFDQFQNVQFYDYTKAAHRLTADWRSRKMPTNYDLTLSYSGHNWAKCETALNDGGRVAIVFGGVGRTKPLPSEYNGFPVHDGDITDLTFTRPAGILGLRAKGIARKAYRSRFIVWDHNAASREARSEYRFYNGIG